MLTRPALRLELHTFLPFLSITETVIIPFVAAPSVFLKKIFESYISEKDIINEYRKLKIYERLLKEERSLNIKI